MRKLLTFAATARVVVVGDERVNVRAVRVVEEREVVATRSIDAAHRTDERVFKVSVAVAVEFQTHHFAGLRDNITRACYACNGRLRMKHREI